MACNLCDRAFRACSHRHRRVRRLVLIVVTEVSSHVAAAAKFGGSTYRHLLRPQWQPPSHVEWGEHQHGLVIGTTPGSHYRGPDRVVLLIIAGWHNAFGLANLIVLVLFGAWCRRDRCGSASQESSESGATKHLRHTSPPSMSR